MIKILLFTLLLSTPLFSEEVVEPQETADTQKDSYQNITERKENAEDSKLGQLEQLTKDPKFAPVLAACEADKGTEDYSTCINDAFLGEGKFAPPNPPIINEDVRKELSKQYLSSGDMEDRYGSADLGTMQEQYNDPALEVLKKHLYERLQEALYGEITEGQKDKPIQTVDHKLFYELYKSQISKNIILALTSYCYDSKLDGKYLIKKDDIKKNNAENKAYLSQMTEDESTLKAAEKWGGCIREIPNICADDSPNADKDYSVQRACEVTGYLKDLRQNLMRLTEIEKSVKDQSNKKGLSLGMKKPIIVNYGKGSKSQKSIDEMTSITSGEIKEITDQDDYTDAETQSQEERDLCRQAKNADDPACQKFLISEEEQKTIDQANTEYSARVAAMKTKLKSMDEEGLKAYLADEGRSEDDIKMLIENNKLEDLKSDIAQQYANEKKAIIARMNERLQGRTIAASDPKADPAGVMQNIDEELQSRAKEYTELIHFNNIVSGYLSVGEDGDRNVASVNREMESSAFTESKEEQKEHDLLLTAVETTLNDSGSGDNDSVTMDVETLNAKILTSTVTH